MMRYLISNHTDPAYNLALEQYVFDHLDRSYDYLMLWQNDNTIVIGKYQNTFAEIDRLYTEQQNIHVVRRLSGGGAVYHDLGNLNYTFITDAGDLETIRMKQFCEPVVRVLNHLGVPAKVEGRNDMTVEGRKFSGNAQYVKQGRVMHHGTLLFDSDLSVLSRALIPQTDKFTGKGITSVRSRVCNLREYLPEGYGISDFCGDLIRELMSGNNLLAEKYILSEEDERAIKKIQRERYEQWDWNFGRSPACGIEKSRRIEGVGKITVYMDLDGASIKKTEFFGDFFSAREPHELAELFTDCPLNRKSVEERIADTDVSMYFTGISREEFIELMLQ